MIDVQTQQAADNLDMVAEPVNDVIVGFGCLRHRDAPESKRGRAVASRWAGLAGFGRGRPVI
jgi:hypothetical protein